MFNFLSLLGWSPGDDRQKLDRDELIREFGLKGVGRSGAVFDLKKLEWLNGEYLADMAMDELEPRVRAALEEAGLWRDAFAADERERFHAVVDLLRSRARFVSDFVEFGRPLLDPSDELSYDEAAAKKHLKGEALEDHLRALRERLAAVDDWTPEPLEAALRAVSEERGVGAGKLIHPTRLAVTGRGVSPGIFEVLEVLGRERSLRRLDRMIEHVAGGGSG